MILVPLVRASLSSTGLMEKVPPAFDSHLKVSSLLFLGCLSTDDDEYRPIWLTAQNAFDFPLQNEFSVGDTLYVEQYFSRYLPEEGYEELLDVYETTKDEEFGYSFQIEKYSNLR